MSEDYGGVIVTEARCAWHGDNVIVVAGRECPPRGALAWRLDAECVGCAADCRGMLTLDEIGRQLRANVQYRHAALRVAVTREHRRARRMDVYVSDAGGAWRRLGDRKELGDA